MAGVLAIWITVKGFPWQDGVDSAVDGSTSGIEPTVTNQGATSSEPTTDDAGDQAANSDVAYAPYVAQTEIAATDGDGDVIVSGAAEGSTQSLSSSLRFILPAATDAAIPAIASPRLAGGTFNVSYDFEALTVSGDFRLAFEYRVWEDSLCPGSPQDYHGTVSGSFEDMPLVPTSTSNTAPENWGLPAEDWYPKEEGNWFVGGGVLIDLTMSGVVVPECRELDGTMTYVERPVDAVESLTAWMDSGVDIWRDQGPDQETLGALRIHMRTNEPPESDPFWDFELTWADIPYRPLPDPLEQ